MIGLKRGTVKLRSYDKGWEKLFAQEKAKILEKIGDLVVDVRHIGSTSVPGIQAKPIIDMAAGVRRLKDIEGLTTSLRDLGYRFDRSFQHQRFFAKGPDSNRTHYLHVMRYGGAKWRNDALFRDYLIQHPRHARKYSELKTQLAEQYPNERQRYSDGKDKFIKDTITLAKHALS